MITFTYPVHPRKGYLLDLGCPAVICDTCGALCDEKHPGIIAWRPNDSTAWHVHKGQCDRALQAATGEHLYWRDLDRWLSQVAYNYANPLIGGTAQMDSGDEFPIKAVRTINDHDVTPTPAVRVRAGQVVTP